MRFIKRQWKNFVEYILMNKKTIVTNYIIFAIVSAILLIIDLVCKKFLFDGDNLNETTYENWLFGIRSVKNPGLFFITSLEGNIALITIFNVLIWIACFAFVLFLRSYWFAIFIGFIFSGSMGNSVDRLAFSYVRDIIYLPWMDKGTFNFADVDVVVGSIGVVITLLVSYFVMWNKGKR